MRSPILLAVLLTLTLAACAQTPKGAPGATASPTTRAAPAPAAPVATPGLGARERQNRAVELLGTGQGVLARAELLAVLAEQPGNAVARKLLDQIDRDPRELLGEKHYVYKVRPGDSMSSLADRLLGDSLMFYGLARYNNITDPSQMSVGQTLLIPGVPRKVVPAKPTAAAATPAPAGQRNPVRAGQLRGQALEQMNRGAINKAVGLLRQALALDPGNPVIQRDLDRAVRIQANVRR
ncbi:MAG: LysM domain-containing protein [Phenylobacterium sp.]|uniref:LysM peptidoglycan-binding domain-containing protein n=1 Tax=Phenylobacterium sp. TaxID=1871053 RepID=UPI00273543E6|nr:LysM domain-containing protein [Phenylobacterium sp.]MDP3747875.1 LysM domain-containing protein [Phenylobacterium sp.]